MSVRSNGVKKSNFPAQTTVLSGATFDYVINGVNYKITYENLLLSLGATGTLSQYGDGVDMPVFVPNGSDNQISNLKAGSGITLTRDASGSIIISSP